MGVVKILLFGPKDRSNRFFEHGAKFFGEFAAFAHLPGGWSVGIVNFEGGGVLIG